jgi:hypothetical protein
MRFRVRLNPRRRFSMSAFAGKKRLQGRRVRSIAGKAVTQPATNQVRCNPFGSFK